jgi:polysaccharide pyruvyl transferase CsaB
MIPDAKVVLVAGAYGYGNTGDDLLLRYLVNDLRAAVPHLRIIVLSDNPDETSATYNIESVHWQNINQIVQLVRQCDLMMLGGGGLFYDYWGANSDALLTRNHAEISYFAGLSLLSRLLEKPLLFYAVGAGPLLTDEGRLLTCVAFEQATLVTVRDPQSKALLEQIGIPSDRILVTADPAFQMPLDDSTPDDGFLQTAPGQSMQRPLIGVALRQWNVGVEPESWESAVAAALDSFIDSHGGTAIFIPFHRAVPGGLADDRVLAHRVRDRMLRKAETVVLQGEYTPEELQNTVSQCDLLLGMRLHAVIFAFRTGVPVVALTYDPKVSNTLARFSQESAGIAVPQVTGDRLAAMLEASYQTRASFKAQVEDKLRELEALSRENSRLVIELLNSTPPDLPALSVSAVDVLNREVVRQTISDLGFTQIVDRLISGAKIGPLSAAPNGQTTVAPLNGGNESPGKPGDLGRFIELARHDATPPQKRWAPARNSASRKPQVAYLAYMLLDWETQKPRFGGGERYALTLGSLLRDLGFEVTFFQAATSRFTGEYYGFPVISIPFAESYSEFQYGLSDEFYRLTSDYDHIIYNLAEFATGEMRDDALLICHGIWFDHNNYPPPTAYRTQEWFSHLYRAFSRPCKIVSVDTNSINVMRALWPEMGARMTYVPNWVDTQTFVPAARLNGDRPTVLFPRRSQINRGSRMIGPILEQVEQDCVFLWVGEGEKEETDHIKAVAQRDPRLRFEAAPFESMPQFYQQADICVISSLGSEGTSLSCLEALASGCAVISSNVGGLPNLIHHEINGLLVEPEPSKIAAAISLLITDPHQRTAYQQAGVATARHFDISQWRKRWIDLLHLLRWIA